MYKYILFYKRIFWLFIPILINSCSPYVYYPTIPLTPISSPDQSNLLLAKGNSLTSLQYSISPVNNFSFGFAGDFKLGIHKRFGSLEAGAAYYKNITDLVQLGVYSGYGITGFSIDVDCVLDYNGNCDTKALIRDYYEELNRQSNQLYHKIFVQPYLTFMDEDIRLNIGSKVTYALYPEFYVVDNYYTDGEFDHALAYPKKESYLLGFQPYFSVYFGANNWQGMFGASYQIIPFSDINSDYLFYPKYNISFGIARVFKAKVVTVD